MAGEGRLLERLSLKSRNFARIAAAAIEASGEASPMVTNRWARRSLRVGKKMARAGAFMPMQVGKKGYGMAEWGSKHARVGLGLAALAGVVAAKPLGQPYEMIVNDAILGQPHATKNILTKSVLGSIQYGLASPSERRYIDGGYQNLPGYGDTVSRSYQMPGGYDPYAYVSPNITNRYGAPTGDVVFGMWNMRQKELSRGASF